MVKMWMGEGGNGLVDMVVRGRNCVASCGLWVGEEIVALIRIMRMWVCVCMRGEDGNVAADGGGGGEGVCVCVWDNVGGSSRSKWGCGREDNGRLTTGWR